MILSTEKENYKVGKYVSLILPEQEYEQIERFLEPPENLGEAVKERLKNDMSEGQIKQNITNARILILELSRDCNLRCRYCGFSGNYKYFRTHQASSMKTRTAHRAIDFFLKNLYSRERITTLNEICISFYGGESLLEFDTLLNAVKYAKAHRIGREIDHLKFYLTTNGVLLVPETVKQLAKEDIDIDISLDGPREEHDKFRVRRNGKGSWQKIMKNVRYIKKYFPDYYDKKVRFLVTVHPYHDIKKMETFFLENKDIFNEQNVRTSQVILDDLNLSPDDKKKVHKAKKELFKKIHSELRKDKWFYKNMAFRGLDALMGIGTHFLSPSTSFTATCFPGGIRLYVDVDGNFHICEKMNHHFPIGNVDEGFDIKMINSILKKWNRRVMKLQCWNCSLWFMCAFCFAACGKKKNFTLNKGNCRRFKKAIEADLKRYIELKEVEDETGGHSGNYRSVSDFLESV